MKITFFVAGLLCLSSYLSAQHNLEIEGTGSISQRLAIGLSTPSAPLHISEPYNQSNGILIHNKTRVCLQQTQFGCLQYLNGSGLGKINVSSGTFPGLESLNLAVGTTTGNLVEKAVFGPSATSFINSSISNNGTTYLNGRMYARDDIYTNWAVTFYHDDGGFMTAHQVKPWLNKGWTAGFGDYLYLSSSGNRNNNEQYGLLLNQNGFNIGRGDDDANNLDNIYLSVNDNANGPLLRMYKPSGTKTLEILAAEAPGQGAQLSLYDNAGQIGIELDADYNGVGRVRTDELEIRGGADFAENFDIVSESIYMIPIPGQLVSIDPSNEGKLEITQEAYDKKVAGIISGANGVKSGVIMGQEETIANGEYPIALSGRVYVKANSSGGQIKPGDFITSSNIAGQAMKVSDFDKSRGAIVGKAMTSIDDNGYVLVLVNLQ